MNPATSARRPAVATAVGVLLGLYALTFLGAASLHLGARIPIGPALLAEPRILPAAIVETVCGLALAVSGYGVLARKSWAWSAAVGGHAVALAGVLLGIVALAAGRGPSTELNDAYHLTMATVLAIGLVLLFTPTARAALTPGASRVAASS